MIQGFVKIVTQKISSKTGQQKQKSNSFIVKTAKKRFLDFYSYQAYKKNINSKIIQFTKEGLGIRSTARILKISVTTLLKRILLIAKNIKQPMIPVGKEYELDEMRLFIGTKSNLQWLVYAIDKKSKMILGFYIGKRTNKTLKTVIKTLTHSKPAKIFTDKLRNYQYLIPKEIHHTKRCSHQHCGKFVF